MHRMNVNIFLSIWCYASERVSGGVQGAVEFAVACEGEDEYLFLWPALYYSFVNPLATPIKIRVKPHFYVDQNGYLMDETSSSPMKTR